MTEDEEYARSELYGLLSMLFYGPPSQVVLDLITDAAIEGEGVLADAWRVLQRASGKTDQDRAKLEYVTLFLGEGQPGVLLRGSDSQAGPRLDAVRAELARLGLERSEHLSDSEDHFGALCDAMHLLLGSLPEQKVFFSKHIEPWAFQLFDAIDASPAAAYYRAVGGLARQFIETERLALSKVA